MRRLFLSVKIFLWIVIGIAVFFASSILIAIASFLVIPLMIGLFVWFCFQVAGYDPESDHDQL